MQDFMTRRENGNRKLVQGFRERSGAALSRATVGLPGATIVDLDEKAIMKAREGYKEHYPNQKKVVDTWSDEVFLNKAKLTIDGKLTNAAILLLGKPESLHYINPKSVVRLNFSHF